jgi:hypothetical protein
MIAAAKGKGLHLTPEEVHDLATDSAIEQVANSSVTPEEMDGVGNHWAFWRTQKPDRRKNSFEH